MPVNPGHCLVKATFTSPSVVPSLRLSILNESYLTFPTLAAIHLCLCVLLVVVEALCLVLVEEVVAVLAVGVEVAILVVMTGLS